LFAKRAKLRIVRLGCYTLRFLLRRARAASPRDKSVAPAWVFFCLAPGFCSLHFWLSLHSTDVAPTIAAANRRPAWKTSESDGLIDRVCPNQCRPKQTDKRERRATRCGVDRLPSFKLAFTESACRVGLISSAW